MLALERRLRECVDVTTNGGWTADLSVVPRRLSRLTLGLYGFGRIARRLAEIAAPSFGRVIAYYPYVADSGGGVELVKRERLLAESDVMSLHAPLTPGNRGSDGRGGLRNYAPGAILVNVARGELIDYPALQHALASGQLRGAALDVLAGEPAVRDDPLRTDPRVLATPGAGGSSGCCRRGNRRLAVRLM